MKKQLKTFNTILNVVDFIFLTSIVLFFVTLIFMPWVSIVISFKILLSISMIILFMTFAHKTLKEAIKNINNELEELKNETIS